MNITLAEINQILTIANKAQDTASLAIHEVNQLRTIVDRVKQRAASPAARIRERLRAELKGDGRSK